MKKQNRYAYLSVLLLLAFIVWTYLLRTIDVRPIGPHDSVVGLATLNQTVHKFIGVHMTLYGITDWLGLVPITTALGFAILGSVQWITRRRLASVDYSLFVLGGFYLVVMAVYILFEHLVINYRPVLIDGFLETSYPSSTTLLVLCVMPTALMQLNGRIRRCWLRWCVALLITAFTVFMVAGRLISGVHWITDIIGGTLLSAGLVSAYRFVSSLK